MSVRPRRLAQALAAAALALGLPGAALACAACTCGNPALTSPGAEIPFAGRLRLATSVRAWSVTEGTARLDEQRVRELRTDLTVSWSPLDRLTLIATLPLQARELRQVDLSRQRGLGLGELELLARVVVHRDRTFSPRSVLAVLGGLRAPPVSRLEDASGQRLSLDAQLGPGGFAPVAGLGWSGFFGARWSAFALATVEVPFQAPSGFQAPLTGRLAAAGQVQPWGWLGLRMGLDARLEGAASQGGAAVDGTAGLVLFAAPEVVVSPGTDLLLVLGARLPAVVTSHAAPSPALLASVVWDV